jgi:rubredoxin
MQSYVCEICDYVYNPETGDEDTGIDPGTAFADIPESWLCPICGAEKDQFSPVE